MECLSESLFGFVAVLAFGVLDLVFVGFLLAYCVSLESVVSELACSLSAFFSSVHSWTIAISASSSVIASGFLFSAISAISFFASRMAVLINSAST